MLVNVNTGNSLFGTVQQVAIELTSAHGRKQLSHGALSKLFRLKVIC